MLDEFDVVFRVDAIGGIYQPILLRVSRKAVGTDVVFRAEVGIRGGCIVTLVVIVQYRVEAAVEGVGTGPEGASAGGAVEEGVGRTVVHDDVRGALLERVERVQSEVGEDGGDAVFAA